MSGHALRSQSAINETFLFLHSSSVWTKEISFVTTQFLNNPQSTFMIYVRAGELGLFYDLWTSQKNRLSDFPILLLHSDVALQSWLGAACGTVSHRVVFAMCEE